jgi:UDPglucose 6-dehydrogenase
VFICLPTPTVNGQCDISVIRDTCKEILSYGGTPTFIIRSTVIPGTNQELRKYLNYDKIVSNPEFLTELTWEWDASNPRLIVLGCDSPEPMDMVKALYEGRYRGIQTYLTDSITAETIKYALNTFFTTKVVFANEFYDICQRIGANYETVKSVLEFHPWGSKNHFKVWHQGGRGAGGKCLPKDAEAFAYLSQSEFFEDIFQTNAELLRDNPKDAK